MCDNLGIRVVLGGVVKNVEKHFRSIQGFINSLKTVLPSLEVCIYENNSVDNTKQLLNQLHEMMPFVQIQCEDYSEEYYLNKFPGRAFDNTSCRMHKIACARNELLKMIEHKNFQFFPLISDNYRSGQKLRKIKKKTCYLSVVTVQRSIRYYFVQLDAI
jgi:hypothetical protein